MSVQMLMSLGHLFHHLVLLVNHLLHLILSQTTWTVSRLFSSFFALLSIFLYEAWRVIFYMLLRCGVAVEHCFSMNLEVLSWAVIYGLAYEWNWYRFVFLVFGWFISSGKQFGSLILFHKVLGIFPNDASIKERWEENKEKLTKKKQACYYYTEELTTRVIGTLKLISKSEESV